MTEYQIVIEETASQTFTVKPTARSRHASSRQSSTTKASLCWSRGHLLQARVSVHAPDGSELLPFEEL